MRLSNRSARSKGSLGVDQNRHGSVIVERDVHVRAKAPRFDSSTARAAGFTKELEERFGAHRLERLGETRPLAFAHVTEQRELRHCQHRATDFEHAEVHFLCVILENAQTHHLVGERHRIRVGVRAPHADEHANPERHAAHELIINRDLCLTHPLNDRSHAAGTVTSPTARFKRRLALVTRTSEPPLAPASDRPETPAWAVTLVRLLDDGLQIPGTHIGIGLDAILGFFFPTLGDAATGLASLSLLVLAFQMRVPPVVMARMVMNIAADTLVGSIPIFGDAFDLFWRSNRRNLQLIERYERDPDRKPTALHYLIVGLGIFFVVAAVVLPLLLGFALLRWLWHAASH